MFTPVFEGKEFGYSVDTETGVYLLFSLKYEITLPLKGDDAKRFGEHIELLKRQNDDTLNERIDTRQDLARKGYNALGERNELSKDDISGKDGYFQVSVL